LVYNRYLLGTMIGCQFFHCWVFNNFKSSALKKKWAFNFCKRLMSWCQKYCMNLMTLVIEYES
jgi:hypothetical protein